jgi:hypothetical protein
MFHVCQFDVIKMFIEPIAFQTQTTSAAAFFSSEDEEHQSAPMMSTPVKNPPSGQAQFVSLYSRLSLIEL